MSKEHKKTDKKKASKTNIEDFVCQMLERLNGMLKKIQNSTDNEELELPDGIGPSTDSVLKNIKESEPITKVRKFILIPGGEHNKVEEIMNKLISAREADINNGLRTVFAQIHKAKTSDDVAFQMQAIRSLDMLIREASVAEERNELITARNLVLSGDKTQLDAANFRLRNVFSSRVDSNVRLAYTSLSTQFGEGYQLCPKSIHQIGKAIPMEISKCRDNCIDCRVTRDGAVTCAYAEWLRKSADNHELAEARLERVKHNLNGEPLNKIGSEDSIKNWEGQLDDIRSKYPGAKEQSLETTLDGTSKGLFGHQGEAIKRIQEMIESKKESNKSQEEELETGRENEDYDDETLEQMLEDEREPFSEKEIDMMIEELLENSRSKD